MRREVVPSYVIQSRETGLFLTEELGFSKMLREAGRLHDVEEAADTAALNFDPGEYDIVVFWDLVQC